jgi:hypothetical protein
VTIRTPNFGAARPPASTSPVGIAGGCFHLPARASANSIVKPVHAKAMPVLLVTDTDVETWLAAPTDEALKLQKPAPDDAVVVLPEEMKAG